QRESKLVNTGLVPEQLKHGQFDRYLAAGGNIRDRLGKDIGTLLVEQRRGMAGVPRLLEDLARLFALFDDRADFALSYCHGHAVHGAVMRQRKDVNGLHGIRQDILKFLRDLGARDKAADFSLDAGVFERHKPGHLAVFAKDLELAASGWLAG